MDYCTVTIIQDLSALFYYLFYTPHLYFLLLIDCQFPLDFVQYPRSDSPVSSNERHRILNRGHSPDCHSHKSEPKKRLDSNGKHTEYLEYYPGKHSLPEQNKSDRNKGNYNYAEPGPLELYESEPRSKNKDNHRWPEHTLETRAKYPEEVLTEREFYPKEEYCVYRHGKKFQNKSDEKVYDEQKYFDDSSYLHKEQNRKKDRNEGRGREERKNGNKTKYLDRNQDKQLHRDANRDIYKLKEIDTEQNAFTHKNRDMERERHNLKEKDRVRERKSSRDRNRGRELDSPTFLDYKKCWSEPTEESTEYNTKQRFYSGSDDVFKEPNLGRHSKGQAHLNRGMNGGPCF